MARVLNPTWRQTDIPVSFSELRAYPSRQRCQPPAKACTWAQPLDNRLNACPPMHA